MAHKKKYHHGEQKMHKNAGHSEENMHEGKGSHYLENDPKAIANMPQNVRIAAYPKCSYMDQDYDDSMENIDAKQRDTVNKMSKNYMRRKGG